MLLAILLAQLAAGGAPVSAGSSEQDRVNATEVFAYARWRSCLLKETHRASRTVPDHMKVADLALSQCGTKEANYRSSLTSLARLYKLPDPDDFVRRNAEQARTALRAMMIKELE